MAKVQTILNLEIPAGKAQPAPPLGPMLWANGVNIGQFTKEFNEKTADYMKKFAPTDVKIKCKLTIFVEGIRIIAGTARNMWVDSEL